VKSEPRQVLYAESTHVAHASLLKVPNIEFDAAASPKNRKWMYIKRMVCISVV
jgi:hypothetical protein